MHQRHKLVSAMLWITFGLASGRLFASAETKEEQYTICPERLVANDKLRTLFGRSPLDCIQMCTLAEDCSGVSICHSGHDEQVTCSLSEDVQTAGCDDLNSVPSPSCHSCVKCQFRAGGETWPLRRRGSTNFCQDWATCKAPYNMQDLPSQDPKYFIGLENLHHLLSQAEYKLRVYMLVMIGTRYVSKMMRYTNFSVDAESSSFAVTHDGFDCTNCDADDAFSGSLPVVFVSGGHDVNGCSAQRGGKSGWFGSNCKGSDLFSNGLFYWPVNDTDTEVILIDFAFTRVSTSFYDD
ncbi:ficolin-1-like [Littorina saxatilis]|uniref:ficolin-1-like n=1 Tax=Littorina saxatilis TaxID=31220 RepID=UPI0038B5CC02